MRFFVWWHCIFVALPCAEKKSPSIEGLCANFRLTPLWAIILSRYLPLYALAPAMFRHNADALLSDRDKLIRWQKLYKEKALSRAFL